MKNTQKQKKTISWVVVDPRSGDVVSGCATRQDARDVKLSYEKILRVEIVDGKPNAKFVR